MRARAALLASLLAAGSAHAATLREAAEQLGLGRLGENTPVVVVLRPTRIADVLRRLGLGQQPDVADLQAQAGVDLLDPKLLAVTGIDPDGAVLLGLLQTPPATSGPPRAPRFFHHRAVVALADVERFKLFLAGISSDAKGALQPVVADSPLGKLGVLARAELPSGGFALLRLDGKAAILDAVTPSLAEPAVKLPSAIEVARRPLLVAGGGLAARIEPDGPRHGARRLLVGEGAVSLFVDGRALPLFDATLFHGPRLLKGQPVEADPVKRRERQRDVAACRALFKAPPSFDDVGAAVVTTVDGTDLQVAWSGPGLVVPTVDDDPLHAEAVAGSAVGALSLRQASLAPLRAVPREALFASDDARRGAVDRCGPIFAAELAVRRWPQLIGAMIDLAPRRLPLVGPVVRNLLDQLRNVDVFAFDLTKGQERWTVAATFEKAARPSLALVLGNDGETYGYGPSGLKVSRSPMAPGAVAGLAELPDRLVLILADSTESLKRALDASPRPRTPIAQPPVAQLRFNPLLAVHPIRNTLSLYLLDLATRAGTVEGIVRTQAGLLELTLHTQLRLPRPPPTPKVDP